MGTGKTHAIVQEFHKYKYIIYISTRVTFTHSVGAKYGLYSYLEANDKKQPMEFSDEYPRWIVQIDSLHHFRNLQMASLIIIDEVESLFDQITLCKNSAEYKIYKSFIELLNVKTTIVVMDAELQPQTVQLITQLSK